MAYVREDEFSVCQFFVDGSCEYVRRYVSGKDAVEALKHYINSVGAQIGTTVRVIVTDGGDCTCVEWLYGKGFTYPTREMMAAEAKP